MADIQNFRSGVYNGRVLLQQSGNVGGTRQVFVKLQGGAKNELVFPTFGCRLLNPFKGYGKFYAGDLVEYRVDGTGYILKTFKVVSSSSTTVNIARDGYSHIPMVGDVLMIAPDTATGTGTGVTVSAVTTGTVTVSSQSVPVWVVTTSASTSASANDILVEADKTGAGAKPLVANPNMVLPWDLDCIFNPASTANQGDPTNDTDFENARYLFDPIVEAVMYTDRMQALPEYCKAINSSRVNGWFAVNALANGGGSYTKAEADAKFALKS